MSKTWIVAAVLIAATIAVGSYVFTQNDPIDYNTQVKPILNKKCISCHGGVKREADFSLLFRQEAVAKTESGKPAIIPGDANSSEMIKRITSHDPEVRMPYKKDPLTSEEIETLRKWIDEGAQWGDHWAYKTVEQQEVPASTEWGENDIDKFIVEKLDEQELRPSAQASKETLLRRVSLDIIGMPANEELQKKYLSTNDPKAYEELVDSLLNSKGFGEKWASVWLDLARYSDTKGYERDYIRTIWRYRDWVIDALNRDMPYDSFLIEQIAGDLLPNPTDKQYIATAFHRNTMTNDEGGTENEEYRVAAVLDRVNTTWESLMGTTFACVQCHSHPYDPIRHDEYYKFMAFFNNTRDEDTYEDYPLLRHFDSNDIQQVEAIHNWVETKISKEKANEISLFLKTWQPVFYSVVTDQFVNSALTDTKWLTLRNHGRARLKNVTLDGKSKMIYRFQGHKAGGVWTIRVDDASGEVLAKINVPQTKDWAIEEVEIKPMQGNHDLFFSYENKNLTDPNAGGVMFDWFYFGEELPSKSKEDQQMKKQFWNVLTKQTESTPIMMENSNEVSRATHVFERGNWLSHGNKVEAGVPESLGPLPEGAPRNRLGLAMWLTSKQNPLVSRTIVNRVWEQIYGLGLVETLEDFGTQGIPPTHRELLDHLSWKMMNDYSWSLKTLVKEIVMSSTYQQDSKVTEEHISKDKFNRYLARAPRVRLTSEQVRDQALAVSGLLSHKMYGPGSMPYQPEGVWLSPYNGETWKKSKGDEQYRRAVYTYWKRTAPYPSMMTFDGSAREVCTARRIRTNTPLQALVMLNDSVFVEAAAHLGQRMKKSSPELRKQIEYGFKRAMGHAASEKQVAVLIDLHNKMAGKTTIKKVNSNDDQQLPEVDPMTMVATAIMNLDEFITRN